MALVAFDFETEEILPFPEYPPRPTMLGIYADNQEPIYLSWGHPTGNNCTEADARYYLKMFWDNPDIELIAHNKAFDTAIAVKHWGFDLFRKGIMHDTMVQAFLLEPHAKTVALKPLGEKWLGLAPEEQDAVHDWLISNRVCRDTKDWGAHISKAPGDIVGPYCVGDVERTMRLYKLFSKKIAEMGMEKAYAREIALVNIMLENTLEGVNVDAVRLTNDIELYDRALVDVEALLFKLLECEPFNVDSDAQLADMIDRAHPGLEWQLTPKGKRSTSKANMEITLAGITGELGAVLQYRASVTTCVNTFMRPWLKQATEGDGRMRCQWNTTKSDDAGARTGRLSSKPNMQNIPTLESAKFKQAIKLHAEWLSHLPPLPNVRSYVIADDLDSVLLDRDFSGQELRVMAHFEDGAALRAYQENPKLDLHQWAADMINQSLGLGISRKQTKTCIAKGSLVLTQLGLVKIEDITGLHLLWDGVEYVKHSGLMPMGQKPVFTYEGLTATLDHEVYLDDRTRITFGDAITAGASIAETGRAGQAVRVLGSNIKHRLAESREKWRPRSHLLGGYVPEMRHARMEAIRQLDCGLLEPMSKLLHYKVKTLAYSWSKILRNYAKVQYTALQRLRMVWGQGYSLRLQNLRGVCELRRGAFAGLELRRPAYRQEGQQRELRAGQFKASNKCGKLSKQGYFEVCGLQRPESTAGTHLAFTENRLPGASDRGKARSGTPTTGPDLGTAAIGKANAGWQEVYDIANAGPRHRFTVSDRLVSNCSFAILYGSGLATLAAQMGADVDQASMVKSAYLGALPGLQDLINGLKARARDNKPFRTWGGRVYYCEEPAFMKGRWRTFDYKMVNYLIQGSSADVTKEALIRYHRAKKHGRIILCVHDEICISCPRQYWREEMEILRACMEGIELDCKLISDGEVGYNWHDLIPEDKYDVQETCCDPA